MISASKKFSTHKLFHRGLYFFTLWATLQFFFIHNQSALNYHNDINSISQLSYLFFSKKYSAFYLPSGVFLACICIAGCIFYKRTVLTDLTGWFIYLNLIHYHFELIHGGHYAIALFLFICSFFPDNLLIRSDTASTVWFFCRFQWVIIYFFSAFFKWKTLIWPEGTAIQQIFLSHWFNPFSIEFSSLSSSFFTYLVLLFQTLFPLSFLSTFTRKFFTILGIAIHLFIAIFMNLILFGLFMIWLFWLMRNIEKESNNT